MPFINRGKNVKDIPFSSDFMTHPSLVSYLLYWQLQNPIASIYCKFQKLEEDAISIN